MKKLIVLGMASAMTIGANAQTLEQRVEALEYAGYEDIFRFKGSLEWMYDSVSTDYKDDNANTAAGDTDKTGTKDTVQQHSLYAKIDISAKASDKLSFFGRLSMSKLPNRMNAYSFGSNGDLDGQLDEGQGRRNAEVWMERAFVNYSFTDKLAFTFGRLPTSNGTPYHLTRNEGVSGAYPFLMYNAHFDGMALSYQATKTLNFKLIASPFQFENNENTKRSDGELFETPSTSMALLTEYNKTGLSWARRFNLTAGYLATKTPLALTEKHVNGTPSDATDDAVTGLSDLSINVKRTVIALEVNDILSSGFDFNLQHMMAEISNEGSYKTYLTSAKTTVASELYFLASDDKELTSTVTIATVRYNINSNNKFGVQLSKGSQHSFASDLVSKLPLELVTAGTVTHAFYNHAFDGGLKLNIGVISSQTDYKPGTGGVFGERTKADIKADAAYTSFVANF